MNELRMLEEGVERLRTAVTELQRQVRRFLIVLALDAILVLGIAAALLWEIFAG